MCIHSLYNNAILSLENTSLNIVSRVLEMQIRFGCSLSAPLNYSSLKVRIFSTVFTLCLMAWCPDPLFLREQSFKSPSKHTQTPRRGSEMNETLFLIYYLNPNSSRFYFILKEELCLYKTVHIKSSQGNRISVCFVILMWQFRFRITAIKFSNTMFEVTL